MRETEKLGEAPIGRLLLSNTIHSSAALVAYGIYNITFFGKNCWPYLRRIRRWPDSEASV